MYLLQINNTQVGSLHIYIKYSPILHYPNKT